MTADATIDQALATEQPTRRYDLHRRDRIIDACVDVIAEVGVAGTSHRTVVEAADVPLGSMTYHVTNMTELLREAFTGSRSRSATGSPLGWLRPSTEMRPSRRSSRLSRSTSSATSARSC